jgi:hypothetical protein
MPAFPMAGSVHVDEAFRLDVIQKKSGLNRFREPP